VFTRMTDPANHVNFHLGCSTRPIARQSRKGCLR
jgi:hypothetical protein